VVDLSVTATSHQPARDFLDGGGDNRSRLARARTSP